MKKHIKYLRYVIVHKWNVMIACFKRGLIWQGITHDLSKFRPSEWFAYANYFYGKSEKELMFEFRWIFGFYTPLQSYTRRNQAMAMARDSVDEILDERKARLNRAWLLHQHRNPHHWQFWVLRNDDGGCKALEMPKKYRREMICDWEGAGRAIQGGDDAKDWYYRNRNRIILHPATRVLVEQELGI